MRPLTLLCAGMATFALALGYAGQALWAGVGVAVAVWIAVLFRSLGAVGLPERLVVRHLDLLKPAFAAPRTGAGHATWRATGPGGSARKRLSLVKHDDTARATCNWLSATTRS